MLPLYVMEPSLLCSRDFDPCHRTFIRSSLAELRVNLASAKFVEVAALSGTLLVANSNGVMTSMAAGFTSACAQRLKDIYEGR